MSKLPFMKFYPADYLKDPGLAACSLQAQGLWMRMLCQMWECPERGVLKTGKQVWGCLEIATVLAKDVAVTQELVNELVSHGVVERRWEDGAYFNRRMEREERERQGAVNRQRKHRTVENKSSHASCHANVTAEKSEVIFQKSEVRESKSSALATSEAAFARFWESYPRRVAREKAFESWKRKVSHGEIEAVMAGLELWKLCPQWADTQFIPYPATFLNQRRWCDLPEAGHERAGSAVSGQRVSAAQQRNATSDAAAQRMAARLLGANRTHAEALPGGTRRREFGSLPAGFAGPDGRGVEAGGRDGAKKAS